MSDVTVDQLDIVVEIDADGADTQFARLFQKYVRRWWEAEQAAAADRGFAEQERRVRGGAAGRGPGGAGTGGLH